MSGEREVLNQNDRYSVAPMNRIMNAMAPVSTHSGKADWTPGDTAIKTIDMRLISGNPNYSFHSFSFYVPAEILWSMTGPAVLNDPNSSKAHWYEGGRFTMTSMSALWALHFKPVAASSDPLTVRLIVG